MAGEKDKKQILKISGKKQFLEVMANCINIDRLYINFEDYDDTKPKGQRKGQQVQIYIDMLDAYVLAKDIFSGKIDALGKKSRETAKAGGYTYAKEVFSRTGGVSAVKLAKMGAPRKDKMSLSRTFKITPGIKTKWVLSAESGPGEENANRLIVPKYKTPEQIIRVGMNDEQLKVFASAIELLAHAWMREKINGLVLTQEIKM